MQSFELHHQAVAILEHPQQLEPRAPIEGYRPRLRLWHYPATDVYRSWLLLDNGGRWVARQAVWDRSADAAAPRATPTITFQDTLLDGTPIVEVLARLEGTTIKLPAVDAERSLADGDHYGVHVIGATRDLRIEWWDSGPPGWEPVVDWAAKVRAILRAVLGAASAPPSSPTS